MARNPNRNEVRHVKALMVSDGLSRAEALRRFRDRPTPEMLASGRSVQEFFDVAGFDVRDVVVGDIGANLRDLLLVEHRDVLAYARSRGLGLFLRLARMVGLPAPSLEMTVSRAEAHIAQTIGSIGTVAPDGTVVTPDDAVDAYYTAPTIAAEIRSWLDHDHPTRVCSLAGLTWSGRPPRRCNTTDVAGLLAALDTHDVAVLDGEVKATVQPLIRERLLGIEAA